MASTTSAHVHSRTSFGGDVLKGVTGFGDWITSIMYTLVILFGHRVGTVPSYDYAIGAVSAIYLCILGFVVFPYLIMYMRFLREGEGGTPALMERLYERFSFTEHPGRYRLVTAVGGLSIALMIINAALTTGITQFGSYDGVSELPSSTRYFWMALPGVALIAVYMMVSTETRRMKAMIVTGALALGAAAFAITRSEATGLVVFNVSLFFCMQRFKLDKICRALGPITLAFVGMITLLSVPMIMAHPQVLSFLNPFAAVGYAGHFIQLEWANGGAGRVLTILTVLFLAMTGGEAPFADAAPLGKRAIRLGAVIVTIPVLLSYAAQAAAISSDPSAAGRSFYALVPNGYAGIVFFISNLMANAACQALTTALFVMVAALVKAHFTHEFKVVHRGHHDDFVPAVNWVTGALVIGLAIYFKSADAFAGVYGLTVSSVMLISGVLVTAIRRAVWKKSKLMAFGLMAPIIGGNLLFVIANAVILDGAWIALAVGFMGMLYLYHNHMRYRIENPHEAISLQ